MKLGRTLVIRQQAATGNHRRYTWRGAWLTTSLRVNIHLSFHMEIKSLFFSKSDIIRNMIHMISSPFSSQVLKPSFYFLFLRSSYGGSTTFLLSFFFGFIWLLPLGVTAANHLSQSHPIPRILLCHTNPLYVFFLYTHPPSLWFPSTTFNAFCLVYSLCLLCICSYHLSCASLTPFPNRST